MTKKAGISTAKGWALNPPIVPEQRGYLVPGKIPAHVSGTKAKTEFAMPGIIHEPLQAMQRMVSTLDDAKRAGMTPDMGRLAEDALTVASSAAMGGIVAPKPVGALGTFGGKLKAFHATPNGPLKEFDFGFRDSFYFSPHEMPNYGKKPLPSQIHPTTASPNPHVLEVELEMKNPWVIDRRKNVAAVTKARTAAEVEKRGYDGVILKDSLDPKATEYIATKQTIISIKKATPLAANAGPAAAPALTARQTETGSTFKRTYRVGPKAGTTETVRKPRG